MSYSNNNNTSIKTSNFTKQYLPCFFLEDKYYDNLTNPKQIAVYSFLARCAERNLSETDAEFSKFCQSMEIMPQEIDEILEHLYIIGFLKKRD